MKERWVEVAPNTDGKREKQFETWLWGEAILVGIMGLCEKQKDPRAGESVLFRLPDLEKGKKSPSQGASEPGSSFYIRPSA